MEATAVHALIDLLRQGAAETDVERLLALVTERAGDALGADYVAVILIRPDGAATRHGVRGSRSTSWGAMSATSGETFDGTVRRALAERQAVWVEQLGEDPNHPWRHYPLHRDEGGRTALAAPLCAQGQAFGALVLGWRSDVAPSATQALLAEGLAAYAAMVVAAARAHERAEQLARDAAEGATRLAAAVGHSRTLYAAMVDHNPDAIYALDRDGRLLFANEACTTLTGYSGAELVAMSVPLGLIIAQHRSMVAACFAAATAGQTRNCEATLTCKDGQYRAVQLVQVPLVVAGQVTGVYGVAKDITPQRQVKEALWRQALHDALTGLPNRTLLYDRLQQAVLATYRDHRSFALLLLDLNHFKEVNDTLGHRYGDMVLQEVAARLLGTLRASDTVARLGGDEFAVLLPGSERSGALQAARKIQAVLDAPIVVEGRPLHTGASVGIALYPEHGADPQTLLRRADVAMYNAKRSGHPRAVYTAAQDAHSPARLALVEALHRAITGDELVLHYQPKVDIVPARPAEQGGGRQTGLVSCVEALVRWQHPEHGLLLPDQFVPVAEQAGLIGPLTRWVLRTALRQCRAWRDGGLSLDIAVNLSASNLKDARLVETINGLLARYALPTTALRVELTESTIMTDTRQAAKMLRRLAARGVPIAIDDFGTGYSSLAYLKRLPVSELKIDKAFVLHMTEDAADAAIVSSTIGLGHNLGLRVVAEGVETPEAWALLAAMDCDAAQGHYLGQPLPASELTRWLCDAPWVAVS